MAVWSHRPSIQHLCLGGAALAVLALGVAMAIPPYTGFLDSHTSMLSVHMLMELFAVVIAMLIVVVSWHTFDPAVKGPARVLIGGFVVVAVCDVVHALTYEGMPAFLMPSSTPRAIFFWLMGRTAEVLTLALVALQWSPAVSHRTALATGVATALGLVWVGSYHVDWFPVTFVKGQGVTAFKAGYEYTLCAANLTVAALLWRQADSTGEDRYRLMALSAFVMGVGELMFTSYVAPSDFQNLFGHTYKVMAYTALYWATFVTSIRAPYERMQASEARWRESEERIRSLSNHLPHAIVFQVAWPRGAGPRYTHVSQAVAPILGLQAQAVMADPECLHRLVDPTDFAHLVAAMENGARSGQAVNLALRYQTGDGLSKWLEVSTAPRRMGPNLILWDGVLTEITARKRAEAEIERLGFYDSLTGLPNRRLLIDRLNQALAVSQRSGQWGALLFIDLDHFKEVNDTLGHQRGDELLLQVAQRLSQQVRGQDSLARFGGDEFVLMLVDLGTDPHLAANHAKQVAEKLLMVCQAPFVLGKAQRFLGLSIGIDLFGHDAATVDDLLKAADLALYRAKSAGRGTYRFFDPGMQTAATERAQLEADLRDALQAGQFLLHYQPLIDRGHLCGLEALVRWQHPDRGLVSPAKFIPVAEETGLIVPLGQWVLETACRQLVAWAETPSTAALTVAVNVSVRQFRHPEFLAQVEGVIQRTGVNPQRLKLELTESLLVDDVEAVIAKMGVLRARGVQFSLDDFGTGYSSLTYLKRLPLSTLKIDQSFVRDVLDDPNDAAIVRAIIALGQSLGLQVIAEGVETEGQRDFLHAQGCHVCQGYLYCRPLALDALQAYLAQHNQKLLNS